MSSAAKNSIRTQYCVYLTVYSGNLLPPFYIGSTRLEKANSGRYFGSVQSKKYRSTWRREINENPAAFRLFVIQIFDDRKSAFERERELQIKLSVIKNPLYANLSFGHKDTAGGWNKGIPAWNKGKRWGEATREKIRLAKSNISAETRRRMSEASKRRRPTKYTEQQKAERGANISAGRTGIKHKKPAWNKGRTGVYSEDVIEGWAKAKLGKPNLTVSASNRRRIGMKYRQRSDKGIARPHLRKAKNKGQLDLI